jgi:aryl-phospho-beta-D-glucosidase BglC (GH1 family)
MLVISAWMSYFVLTTFSLPRVGSTIVDRYADHPAVLGIEPVNEPWQFTPIDALKRFYWEGYLIVKRRAPYWKYIIHDAFRFDENTWGVSAAQGARVRSALISCSEWGQPRQ